MPDPETDATRPAEPASGPPPALGRMPDPEIETDATRPSGAARPGDRGPEWPETPRGPRAPAALALVLAAVLAAGFGAVALAALSGGTPEAGVLEQVRAQPPEQSEERVLGQHRPPVLASVLAGFGLERRDRTGLEFAFREVANPRSLLPDVKVTRRWRDDPSRPHVVEVVLDPDRTVLLARSAGGWAPKLLVAETTIDTLAAAGEIEAGSSLWQAVRQQAELSEMSSRDQGELIHGLDQVFRWQIDFSRQLRPGDSYSFVAEREVRPDGTIRSVRHLAADLVNRDRKLHAVWFDPGGEAEASWFDLDGQSVRRAFLKKPLDFRRISSRFSNRRFHPVLRRWRAHRGVDYAADSGTPVHSTGDGEVSRRGWSDSYGRVIDVRHANGFLTRYAHLSRWASGTAVGSRVAQGQTIGYVGMTGLATGPHLHYEMHQGGRAIDPIETDLPAGDPVPAQEMERFEREKAVRLALLPPAPGRRPPLASRIAPEDAPGP